MTTSTRVRRSVAVLAATGATAAMTLLAPVGAQAAVHGQYAAFGDASVSYTGSTSGGACTLTSGDDNTESHIATFTHGTKHRSVDLDATYTSSDNASDTVRVKGHIDSRLTLKKKHRDLTSFELAAGGKLRVTHSVLGSTCRASGQMLGGTEVVFTEHKKGWFYITHDTHKPNSLVEAFLVNLDTEKLVMLDAFEGTHSHATSRALIRPGRYELFETQAGITVGGFGVAKAAQRTAKATLTSTISGEFKPLKKKH